MGVALRKQSLPKRLHFNQNSAFTLGLFQGVAIRNKYKYIFTVKDSFVLPAKDLYLILHAYL